MIDYNKVPSGITDAVWEREQQEAAWEVEECLEETCHDIIQYVDGHCEKYESPEQERYMTLLKKSALLRLNEIETQS